MPTIVHFEIPTDDIERSKKFYNDLFGWNIEKWPGAEDLPGGPEYLMITTMDDKGNKALTGGMMKREMPEQQGITNYLDVKSVDAYSAKVAQLGGQVRMSKTPVPGLGYFAICTDTENNGFAIWETDSAAK
jgi:predicted enzyme related to lactoylglutathione lyase